MNESSSRLTITRAIFLCPTVLGQRLKDEVLSTLHAHFDELGIGLAPAQTQEFVALLKIVRAHLRDVARKPENSGL